LSPADHGDDERCGGQWAEQAYRRKRQQAKGDQGDHHSGQDAAPAGADGDQPTPARSTGRESTPSTVDAVGLDEVAHS
jgi:hypothetical protein